jgi:hypothetical protein
MKKCHLPKLDDVMQNTVNLANRSFLKYADSLSVMKPDPSSALKKKATSRNTII